MAPRIRQNIAALAASRYLANTRAAASISIERLASGERINRAADDPAGLVRSEHLRAQTSGLERIIRNTHEKINSFQVEDAKLDEVFSQLRSIRNQALEALNTGALDSSARSANQTSVHSSIKTASKSLSGVNSTDLGVDSSALDSIGESLVGIDVTTEGGAEEALAKVDSTIDGLSTFRGELGAHQSNALEADIRNLGAEAENLRASASAIRDTDFADEVAELTRERILFQANTAVLVQANSSAKSVLKLLNGGTG